jgi:exosortase
MDAIENQILARPMAERRPSFWSEFQDYLARVPEKWLFLTLMASWCVLFQFVGISSFNFGTTEPSLFEWLYHAWNEPKLDCSQGSLIPFVVVALFWVKRRELAASISGVWWPALAVVALALLVHVVGFLAQQPRVSMIALFLGMYGLIGVVWGRRTMWVSFFPMMLFAFCMPLGTFAEPLTLPLRLLAATWTRMICHGLLGIDVVQRGTALFDPKDLKFNYDVAVACSGIRSFVALLAVTTVFAMLSLRSVWKRALMIVTTVPLVMFCNVLRLVVVILITQAYGEKQGMWVHGWFGFVTYMVAIGSMLLMAHWLKEKPSLAVA